MKVLFRLLVCTRTAEPQQELILEKCELASTPAVGHDKRITWVDDLEWYWCYDSNMTVLLTQAVKDLFSTLIMDLPYALYSSSSTSKGIQSCKSQHPCFNAREAQQLSTDYSWGFVFARFEIGSSSAKILLHILRWNVIHLWMIIDLLRYSLCIEEPQFEWNLMRPFWKLRCTKFH